MPIDRQALVLTSAQLAAAIGSKLGQGPGGGGISEINGWDADENAGLLEEANRALTEVLRGAGVERS